MMNRSLISNFQRLFLFIVCLTLCGAASASGQTEPVVENLGFKILQKQAADYELSLTQLISKNLSRYIPDDRFHLSVRIYWNPHKIEQLKRKQTELKKTSSKLPGFPVFVRENEQGLDYYMGAGSVMKLKVEVLVDEKLPKRYTDFIFKIVPVQARFVPERGDSVRVVPIRFPESRKREVSITEDLPFSTDEASTALIKSIEQGKKELDDIKPVILHPVLQKYIRDYEKHIIEKLNELIANYVSRNKFLLSMKFFWNPEEIKELKKLVMRTDAKGKVKLPGFTIYLEERESLYEMIANSTTLLRMEISLMLDSSVSPEVEPFMNKMIPMSVKLISQRGDSLTIFRGHFPPRVGRGLGPASTRVGDGYLQTEQDHEDEIIQAFYEGDYRRGLTLIDLLLSKKTDPYERLPLLRKKGSLHLLLHEKELAKAAWEHVVKINSDSRDTNIFLEYLK
ncbi:MAG: hypothetical protein GY866_01685 [Proteobacteria bacterium]|nr:hypothetical protein [Pseudomonadota bacterium]